MRQLLLKRLKNQKGLTLIELLAVIVILGIIAAIAVPSIGGIIENSKKDAHVANAQQMIHSARLAVVGENLLAGGDTIQYIPLAYLEDNGYLETVTDPDGIEYINAEDAAEAPILVVGIDPPSDGSYVVVAKNGQIVNYSVKLVNSTRGVQNDDDYNTPVAEENLQRSAVNP